MIPRSTFGGRKSLDLGTFKTARRVLPIVLLAFTLYAAALTDAAAQNPQASQRSLADLDFEQLRKIPVITPNNKLQPLADSAAAVYVLTAEQIRRSGVTSIPDALRLVPGVHVGRISSYRYAISSRGFNGELANKELVLVDGRAVYTSITGGVLWDQLDLPLEDIEQIEVVRGPGSSTWGTNAVNGVINIITKNAKNTVGTLATAGGGNEEHAFGMLRHGGRVSDDTFYRVYAKGLAHDDSRQWTGASANDDWEQGRTGFRIDSDPSEHDQLMLDGDFFSGGNGLVLNEHDDLLKSSGGHVLGKWRSEFADGSNLATQLYYVRNVRDYDLGEVHRQVGDFDTRYTLAPIDGHEISFGAGARYTYDRSEIIAPFSFDPLTRDFVLASASVQDELALLSDRAILTFGTKFEHNDFTGAEFDPSVRLLGKIAENHSVWGAVSRASRIPSRADNDLSGLAALEDGRALPLRPNRKLDSESLIAYELGYRVEPAPEITVDLASFYNRYDELRSISPLTDTAGTNVVAAVRDDGLEADTYGAEIAVAWQAADVARIRASYSYLQMDVRPDAQTAPALNPDEAQRNPENQASIQVSLDLHDSVQLDLLGRYEDSLSGVDVPAYTAFDCRLAIELRRGLELAIIGQNLFDRRHREFPGDRAFGASAEVERSIFGKITLSFD